MTEKTVLTLVNPQNGDLAFKIFSFEDNSYFDHLQRHNYYSVILIAEGEGAIKADFSEYIFTAGAILSFSPYQPYMISADKKISGWAINFHPDFFCIHKHQKEVSCNGVLFNNIYQPPFFSIDQEDTENFLDILEKMKHEMQTNRLAQSELLISYLKIWLINASRLKVNTSHVIQNDIAGVKEPFILQNLRDAIEQHFKTKHSPSEYADLLSISSKALARITKGYFNKTLTNLISERIVIEAKRELYLTSKPIKEIAYELGFTDEYYFSRFFKTNADVSPQLYRETVGFGRAEIIRSA